MKLSKALLMLVCISMVGFASSGAAFAAEEKTGTIRVISTVALRQVFGELFPQFEKQTGYKIELETGGTVAVDKRVEDGESFDMVVQVSTSIDKLIASGKLKPGSRTDLVRSGIGVAVQKGSAISDISTAEAVKQAVLSAKTIGYSSGPSGLYMLELFKKWGIMDQIKDRLVQPPSGTQIGNLIAKGEVEIGFQQLGEFIHIGDSIVLLGPLPAEIQLINIYSAGITVGTTQQEAVQELLKFLTSPEAAGAKIKNGMEPI